MSLSHSRSDTDRQRQIAVPDNNSMRALRREEQDGLEQPHTAHAPLIAAVLHKYQQSQRSPPPGSNSGVMEKLPNNAQMRGAVSHPGVESTMIEINAPSSSVAAANLPVSSLPGTPCNVRTSSKKLAIVALQLTASDDQDQSGKLTRPEDILKRTRATMIPKSRKKAKRSSADETESSQNVESPSPRRNSCDREARRAHAFPLPTITDKKRRIITGTSLQSYKALWDAMGGSKNKEQFQRRVQNGVVPILTKSALSIFKK